MTITYSCMAPTEIKAENLAPDGLFRGYIAVFNNLDGYKDIIDPGAFTKTLSDARATKAQGGTDYLFPVLWQHQEKEPIGGFVEAHEDAKGLYAVGQLDLDTDLGKRAYSGMQKGYLKGLSIGYDAVRSRFGRDARHLTEIRMWEGSPVTFPANTEAQVTEVKARLTSERERLERDWASISWGFFEAGGSERKDLAVWQRDLNAGQERTAHAFEMAARAAHWERRRSGDLSGLQVVSKQDRQPTY
jgi:HK97 family phage prohead protease